METEKGVIAILKNNNKYIVFYKDGEAIGYNYTYADVKTPGAEDYLEFRFPYDSDYNSIQIDNYKVFVNSSYYYN